MAVIELLGDLMPRWLGWPESSLFTQSLVFTSWPFLYLLQGYVQVLILFWKQGRSQDAPEATPLFYSGSDTTAHVPSYNCSFLVSLSWKLAVVEPRHLTVGPVSRCLEELKRERTCGQWQMGWLSHLLPLQQKLQSVCWTNTVCNLAYVFNLVPGKLCASGGKLGESGGVWWVTLVS